MSTTDSGTDRSGIRERSLAGWEVLSVISSALIAEWMLVAVAGFPKLIVAVPVGLAFALMFLSHRARDESLRDIGFRFDNLLRAFAMLLPPLALLTILLLGVGYSSSSLNFFRWGSGSLVWKFSLALGWALVQQYALQGFINRRIAGLVGKNWVSVLLVASVFAGLHLPNPWLTLLTFCGGAVSAAVYQRAPNLFALALSHAVVTWVAISTFPPKWLHHMRFGLKYFQ